MPGFPYFPAETTDYTDADVAVPANVLQIQPQDESKRYWLVRFYDTQRSYAWVERAKLDGLGDDDSQWSSSQRSVQS